MGSVNSTIGSPNPTATLGAAKQRRVDDGIALNSGLPDDIANRSNRPCADLPGGPCERAGSTRKRTLAEGVGFTGAD